MSKKIMHNLRDISLATYPPPPSEAEPVLNRKEFGGLSYRLCIFDNHIKH